MIARDSQSYPYLAVAQHYNVSYAEVLKKSDFYRQYFNQPAPTEEWKFAVWCLEQK